VVELGSTIRVIRTGESGAKGETPEAPNRSVLMLLIGLVDRGQNWADRADLAARLYPNSDAHSGRTALRTTLHRLIGWLGPDTVEMSGSRVRLATEWNLSVKKSTYPQEITISLDHPWLKEIAKRRLSPGSQSPAALAEAIVGVANSLVPTDPLGARSILLSSRKYEFAAPAKELYELLNRTQMEDQDNPDFWLHKVMVGAAENRYGQFWASIRTLDSCWDYWSSQGNPSLGDQIAHSQIYNYSELGDAPNADRWAQNLAQPGSLNSLNALGCYYWNFGRFDDALQAMERGFQLVNEANPKESGKLATNYYFLAEELKLDHLCERVAGAAVHFNPWTTHSEEGGVLAQVQVMRAIHRRQLDEAYDGINKLEEISRKTKSPIGIIYNSELRAELFAADGRKAAARRLWAQCESWRANKISGRINPRLMRNRQRIAALCA
jgi:tetratricopeptide (TPR) repeat protein